MLKSCCERLLEDFSSDRTVSFYAEPANSFSIVVEGFRKVSSKIDKCDGCLLRLIFLTAGSGYPGNSPVSAIVH